MRGVFLACVLAALVPAATHAAAPPAPPAPPVYVIAYIDVLASGASRAAAVLRGYRDESRGESGAVGIDLFSQRGRPSGFAVIESWRDDAAFETHGKAAAFVHLSHALKSIQLAPPDVRVHTAYVIGPPTADRKNAMTLLVHVDVPPAFLADYERMVGPYIEGSRREAGLLRLDILQSIPPHTNHFTVIESWLDAQALQAHQRGGTAQTYREDLAPKLGALYDERAYRRLD
jgi:quinol monooxygenase YgiN